MGIHRGDAFEEIINITNLGYKTKGIALIQKISTPMKPIRNGNRIVGGYYEEKSTLDYIGVCKGQAIAFDAKETANKSNFPLSNIKDHQVRFMEEWELNGGNAFLLISFKAHNKVYRVGLEGLRPYWEGYKSNPGKKGKCSIAFKDFNSNFSEVKSKNGLILDYLDGLI